MACSSACSKEFNRKELESLLSSVLDNLDDGKVKKLGDEQFKALFHFLNGRDTFACLPTGHGKTLIYQVAVLVARTGKVKILPSNPLVVVVSPLFSWRRVNRGVRHNAPSAWVFRASLTCYEYHAMAWSAGSVAEPRRMLNIAIFDPWQRSLFSRQRTPGKEPLLAGKSASRPVGILSTLCSFKMFPLFQWHACKLAISRRKVFFFFARNQLI